MTQLNYGLSPSEALLEAIASDLRRDGFSVQANALEPALTQLLLAEVHREQGDFEKAGVGRRQRYRLQQKERTDEIKWIGSDSAAGRSWAHWADCLRGELNRQLLLGLFSFESHFSHYGPGDYYKRHLDAFKGERNRILSIVTYLNTDWSDNDGGELVIYQNAEDSQGVRVLPRCGTLVVFLSEDFPHEVLPAKRDRYAIAGWYRANATTASHIDPPR